MKIIDCKKCAHFFRDTENHYIPDWDEAYDMCYCAIENPIYVDVTENGEAIYTVENCEYFLQRTTAIPRN